MNLELIHFIKQQEGQLSAFIDLIPVPIFVKDADGIYLNCNSAFESFIHIPREKLIGNSVYDLWDKDLADIYHQKDQELFDSPGVQVYDSEVKTTDGKRIIVQFYKSTFTNREGEIAGLLGIIFDRTTERLLEDELRELAQYDCLTGLLNRREGLIALQRILAESARNHHQFSIALLDIDYFKEINDKFGHDTGDQVLNSIKQIADCVLREYDLIYRYGGDEFVLCFPETSADEAVTIAERLRQAFISHHSALLASQAPSSGLSIGVACYPEHGATPEALIKASDLALYQAKENGRNQVQLYADKLRRKP